MGLTNQNNELKFRLQAMEQQARLRDGNNAFLFIFIPISSFMDLTHISVSIFLKLSKNNY